MRSRNRLILLAIALILISIGFIVLFVNLHEPETVIITNERIAIHRAKFFCKRLYPDINLDECDAEAKMDNRIDCWVVGFFIKDKVTPAGIISTLGGGAVIRLDKATGKVIDSYKTK